MKTDVATDVEGVRALLLELAPRLEPQQPGITGQIQYMDMSVPVQLMGRGGGLTTVRFEPQEGLTVIKIEVQPPGKPMGRLGAGWWRWRTRFMLKMLLKRAKVGVQRAHPKATIAPDGTITPDVLPPA